MASLNRRDFILGSAAGGLFMSMPAGLYRSAFSADNPPSEKILIGCIGVGNQGRGNLGAHLKNTIAVSEVDSDRLTEAKDRVVKANGKCEAYEDFRKLLENKAVNAVVITTPDHWHALMTIIACQHGKHVYVEKPLTLTVAEGRAMVNAARKNKCIVQTGSQQRSDAKFRQACELVRNGKIGKVKRVLVGIPGVNFKGPSIPDADPPKNLNYDLWLGPAPKRPYNEKRVHYNFRFFWDYSGGQMTNFGAHHLDIAQWGLGMDESGPVEIEGKARYHKEKWFEVPEWFSATYRYADGTEMICSQDHKGGTTFEGEKATIFVTRGKIESTVPELLTAKPAENDLKLYVSTSHHGNWLDCIRSGKLPICDVEIGHRSATVCHLGNIAIRLGRRIKWDPKQEAIIDDKEATTMLDKPYREPWQLKS